MILLPLSSQVFVLLGPPIDCIPSEEGQDRQRKRNTDEQSKSLDLEVFLALFILEDIRAHERLAKC
jgi:hypothetical protein